MKKQPAIYILASQRNGTLYVGVTSNLIRRVWEHKSDKNPGFSRRYGVHMLVYYEMLDTMSAAIAREKQLKAGSREKKLHLIESMNPDWNDLYYGII
ncbi:MAG: GIY-YIG nuclease family protein [Nitrosomonadales bacterium]